MKMKTKKEEAMKIGSLAAAAIFGFMILWAHGGAAEAAEVKVLCASAMRSVMKELGPRFERETGHQLMIQFDVVGALKRQIDAGERFDVAILTTPLIDDLVKEGKIAAGTRADVARSGIGVIVRTGAPKPDINSADAFKRALLNAKSITYNNEGSTAIYLASLFERLGITEQMKPKTKFPPTGGGAQLVAEGEVELLLSAISTFEPVPGAELLGPLPPELQSYTGFSAGVGTAAKEAEAGKALINFLKAPAAVPVLKAKGMEPFTP
jgi:molybdate transport system substrate-binding protein